VAAVYREVDALLRWLARVASEGYRALTGHAAIRMSAPVAWLTFRMAARRPRLGACAALVPALAALYVRSPYYAAPVVSRQQMACRNTPFEIEEVKQLALIAALPPHHDLPPPPDGVEKGLVIIGVP
jgi:hypothetical protein